MITIKALLLTLQLASPAKTQVVPPIRIEMPPVRQSISNAIQDQIKIDQYIRTNS